MPVFSDSSYRKLETCHRDLQRVANTAIKLFDFTVLEGHREKQRQNELYRKGASKVKWPNSKHNSEPSKAFDLAPYPINWGDDPEDPKRTIAIGRFYYLAGLIKAVASNKGVSIRWGGDWDQDQDFFDQQFNDLVHFELAPESSSN